MIETARALSQEPHTYWIDQLNNQDSIAGYHALGEEIWNQTNGEVDAFVQCVGTAASLRGVATVLRRHKPKIKIIAVEPAERLGLDLEPPQAVVAVASLPQTVVAGASCARPFSGRLAPSLLRRRTDPKNW